MKAPAIISALCIAMGACLVSHQAQATTWTSAEGMTTITWASIANNYTGQHDGKLPTSWAELESAENGEYIHHLRDTAERYAFLPSTLLLQPPHEGELFLITRRPFRDDTDSYAMAPFGLFSLNLKEPGRYIIYRGSEGSIHRNYVGETYIQELFKDHPTLLPAPDTAPMRDSEFNAYLRFILTWLCLLLLIAALLTYRLSYNWREQRARTKARADADAKLLATE